MPKLWEIIEIILSSPVYLAAILPSAALMLVNGWTDAPVNIAAAIRSGAIKPFSAILLSAVCNFLGAAVMCLLGSSVAVSIYSISGLASVQEHALPALAGAMTAVVIWSLAAMYFGLPTSESHALTAGLSGAAAAVAGISAINAGEWLKTLLGIALSTLPVAILAFFAAKFLERHANISTDSFKKLQVFGAALSSIAHGAQDGQKFAGVLALTAAMCLSASSEQITVPVWTALVSAVLISLGTLLGGRKIIKRFGELAPANPAAGFASDLVSSVALLLLSVFGLPASTTHAKSAAVIGAGATHTRISKSTGTVRAMLLAWVLTFPISAVLSFIFTRIFISFI